MTCGTANCIELRKPAHSTVNKLAPSTSNKTPRFNNSMLQVHPKPNSTGRYEVKIKGTQELYQVEVLRADGEPILGIEGGNTTIVDLSSHSKGTYLVRVYIGSQILERKVVYK